METGVFAALDGRARLAPTLPAPWLAPVTGGALLEFAHVSLATVAKLAMPASAHLWKCGTWPLRRQRPRRLQRFEPLGSSVKAQRRGAHPSLPKSPSRTTTVGLAPAWKTVELIAILVPGCTPSGKVASPRLRTPPPRACADADSMGVATMTTTLASATLGGWGLLVCRCVMCHLQQ